MLRISSSDKGNDAKTIGAIWSREQLEDYCEMNSSTVQYRYLQYRRGEDRNRISRMREVEVGGAYYEEIGDDMIEILI